MRSLSPHSFFLPSVALFLFTLSGAAIASDFSGCKGSKIGKTDGSVVDISKELSSAEKRMNEICSKNFPPLLKKINESSKQCANGLPNPNFRAADQMSMLSAELYEIDKNLTKSCEDMKKSMELAAKLCSERKSTQQAVHAHAKAQVDAASAAASQEEALKKNLEIYSKARESYEKIYSDSVTTTVQMYQKLPGHNKNFNEHWGVAQPIVGCRPLNLEDPDAMKARRSGVETKDTKDPAFDKMVSDIQKRYEGYAKENKNQAACKDLSSSGGSLAKLSKVKKENFWPNGKRAARSMATLSFSDCQTMNEYKKMEAEAKTNLAKLQGEAIVEAKADASGVEGARYVPGDHIPPGKEVGDVKPVQTVDRYVPGDVIPEGRKVGDVKPSGSNGAVVSALRTQKEEAVVPPAAVIQEVPYSDPYTGLIFNESSPPVVETRSVASNAGEACCLSGCNFFTGIFVSNVNGTVQSDGTCK